MVNIFSYYFIQLMIIIIKLTVLVCQLSFAIYPLFTRKKELFPYEVKQLFFLVFQYES